eukprot:5391906-Ditylum_brightwellii.AAC.1
MKRIFKAISGMEKASEHKVPAATSLVLTKDINGKARQENWNYTSVIGMLNFLVNSTHPELMLANYTRKKWEISSNIWIKYETQHEQRIRSICRCFLCWRVGSENSEDPTSVLSRTGYIKYANCPIVWTSKLQTEIALSTTEVEYVALLQAMKEVIPLIHLLNKRKELANCPKMRPRTKHIAIKYHHFRSMEANMWLSGIITTCEGV